jgi:molybdenum cofactor cytidylyltransferase
MIFQGDQPFIDSEVINLVIKTYLSSGKGIVIPVYEKKRGHPLLIDSKYRSEIEGLDPDKGLRSLAMLHSEDVLEIETGKPGILRDFDTYEDYKSEINKLQ